MRISWAISAEPERNLVGSPSLYHTRFLTVNKIPVKKVLNKLEKRLIIKRDEIQAEGNLPAFAAWFLFSSSLLPA